MRRRCAQRLEKIQRKPGHPRPSRDVRRGSTPVVTQRGSRVVPRGETNGVRSTPSVRSRSVGGCERALPNGSHVAWQTLVDLWLGPYPSDPSPICLGRFWEFWARLAAIKLQVSLDQKTSRSISKETHRNINRALGVLGVLRHPN